MHVCAQLSVDVFPPVSGHVCFLAFCCVPFYGRYVGFLACVCVCVCRYLARPEEIDKFACVFSVSFSVVWGVQFFSVPGGARRSMRKLIADAFLGMCVSRPFVAHQ